jgi:hypothetical protein
VEVCVLIQTTAKSCRFRRCSFDAHLARYKGVENSGTHVELDTVWTVVIVPHVPRDIVDFFSCLLRPQIKVTSEGSVTIVALCALALDD